MVAALQVLVPAEGALNFLPTLRFLLTHHADELLELQEVCFSTGGECLALALVMIKHEIHQFLLVHHGQHLFGESVHIPVGTLHLKSRLRTEFIRLPGAFDVELVHFQHHIAERDHFLDHCN